MTVAVLGAGSFGTALAQVVAQKGPVRLWLRDAALAGAINKTHHHPKRFSDVALSSQIVATTDLKAALQGARFVISAIPMKALAEVMAACAPHLAKDTIVVSTTKGIWPDALVLPHQILAKALGDKVQTTYLSGPNFASEIIAGLPWAAVVASSSNESAKSVQALFAGSSRRIYTSSDVMGVELGGALKNVFAIAAGILDGLGLGCNARAALMTRSLSELSRFALALSAEQKTIYGLSGLGDLLLSCTSSQSRNWRVGHALAVGKALADIEREMGEVAEGVATAQAAMTLAQRYQVEAPICEAIYKVIYEGYGVKEVVMDLMTRSAKEE